MKTMSAKRLCCVQKYCLDYIEKMTIIYTFLFGYNIFWGLPLNSLVYEPSNKEVSVYFLVERNCAESSLIPVYHVFPSQMHSLIIFRETY